jgi:hypothetical protein
MYMWAACVFVGDMGTLDASVTASKGSHLLNVVAVDTVGNQMFRSATFTVQ